jgi:hypothetical protein
MSEQLKLNLTKDLLDLVYAEKTQLYLTNQKLEKYNCELLEQITGLKLQIQKLKPAK